MKDLIFWTALAAFIVGLSTGWNIKKRGERMASFDSSDYEYVFDFAKRIYRSAEAGSAQELQAIEVMNMIEDCIGQQSDFPENARSFRRIDKQAT